MAIKIIEEAIIPNSLLYKKGIHKILEIQVNSTEENKAIVSFMQFLHILWIYRGDKYDWNNYVYGIFSFSIDDSPDVRRALELWQSK